MDPVPGTSADLEQILAWLHREYEDDGHGFWSNRNIIRRSLEDGDLWVIRSGGEAIAFQVGEYSADITAVRKDKKRQGYGTALFEAALARAIRDNVNVLQGECSPRDSLTFWQKHGFERFGDMCEAAQVHVRRVLNRKHELPSDLPRARVTISFYPEQAFYTPDVEPSAVHQVQGARREDGVVLLERRVVGLKGSGFGDGDLAVRVEVDGVERCFCKAKYDAASDAGVQEDGRGACFYVDAVPPARA